ncbi:MAG TPA: hypothetical protein VNA20_09060 [Frankiaceae bacterium]|nr:hypothetical protein [Frankiaceae bacterium]
MSDDALRCAVHPALPAADGCPVCGRPRCAADATAAPGGGCRACEGRTKRAGPPLLDLRALVQAGALCNVVAAFGGQIASQYVGAGFVGYVVPGFVAIMVSIAAEWAAGKKRGRALRLLAAFYSVLAVAVGFQSPLDAGEPFDLTRNVLVAYATAAAVSWLWTAPPRVKKPVAREP